MASRAEADFEDVIRIFDEAGVPFDYRLDAWKVQGTPVIYHKALERLAAKLNITFDDPQMMVQKDDELVMLVRGHRVIGKDASGGDIVRTDWSFAEVTMNKTGANYRVSGKQAGYPWAMLEKRGKDRVILKLAGIEAYSEIEADEFREEGKAVRGGGNDRQDEPEEPREERAAPKARGNRKASERKAEAPQDPEPDDRGDDRADDRADDRGDDRPSPANDDRPENEVVARLKAKLDALESTDAVADFMLDKHVQKALGEMDAETRDEVRNYAKARMGALGWPGGSRAAG